MESEVGVGWNGKGKVEGRSESPVRDGPWVELSGWKLGMEWNGLNQ